MPFDENLPIHAILKRYREYRKISVEIYDKYSLEYREICFSRPLAFRRSRRCYDPHPRSICLPGFSKVVNSNIFLIRLTYLP